MTDPISETPPSVLEPSLDQQLRWAVASLGLSRTNGPGWIRIEPAAEAITAGPPPAVEIIAAPSADREPTAGSPDLPLDRASLSHPAVPTAAALAAELPEEEGPVIDWLRHARRAQQHSPSGAWEAEPEGEPAMIRELAGPLLSPFTVRHGHTRLAGCTLEQHPTLRLGRLVRSAGQGVSRAAEIRWRYYGTDGRECCDPMMRQHDSACLQTMPYRLRSDERSSVEAWVAAVQENEAEPQSGELLDVTVIWCRWASGKIIVQFDGGPSTAIPFAGLARDYAAGRLLPPPFRCSRTGLESYEIIAMEDGTVTVPAAVAKCQLSGREFFHESLATCEASGLRVDREQLSRCEASGRLALPRYLVRCEWCDRQVMPGQIEEGRCAQCRDAGALDASDPRLQRLRERQPQAVGPLGNERNWTGWIGDRVGVIVGGGMWAQRLLVFEPHSGALIRCGIRRRLSRRWIIGAP